MPTIEEFGQSIKQKYPQYQNIDDKELGTKMLEKYPQYKSKVFDTDPQTQQQISGDNPTEGLWDAVKKGVSNIGQGIQESGKQLDETLSSNVATPVKLAKTATTLIKGVINPIAEAAIATPARMAGEAIQGATGYDINEAVSKGTQKLVQKGMETETAQKAMQGWAKLKETDPEAAMALSTVLDIGDIASNAIGLGAEKAGLQAGKNAVKSGITKTGEAIYKAGEKGAEGLSKVGEKISTSGIISPIDESIQGALKETNLDKFNRYVEQATKAAKDNHEITPLEMAGQEATNAVKTMSSKLKEIGTAKSDFVKNVADTKVGNIVKDSIYEFKGLVNDRLGTTFTKEGFGNVKGRLSVISDKADKTLLEDVFVKLKEAHKANNFKAVDDAIDYIQGMVSKRKAMGAVPVNTKVEGIIKKTVGGLNEKLKQLGGTDYQNLNSQYHNIKSVTDKLNNLLGKEGDRAGSLMKRVFSPSDAGTKKLFAKVKEITGHDLVNEATLAKFVMESIGDSRQANLLEQAIKGVDSLKSRNIVNSLVNAGINKIKNPIGRARKIIESK